MINNKTNKELYDSLIKVNYKFNDRYGLSYINEYQFNLISETLSELRRRREIGGDEYRFILDIFNHQYRNESKIGYLSSLEPRKIAQAFIGKKNIRDFIFSRDKKCLCCGSEDKLSIDHINPVNKGGVNELSNLQTLCRSCNSRKSDNYKDYR